MEKTNPSSPVEKERTNTSSLVENAKAFAKTLASSEEFEEYYSLQQKLKNDPEARSLLEELERKHQELRDMMQGKGGQEDAYVAIQELQDKIRDNGIIMSWLQAEQVAIAMIQEANEAITGAAGFDFGQNASTNSAC